MKTTTLKNGKIIKTIYDQYIPFACIEREGKLRKYRIGASWYNAEGKLVKREIQKFPFKSL
ncbi:MAG: hypothetical protein AAFO04_19315 [Cyanobacteria bacterium J06592_8]